MFRAGVLGIIQGLTEFLPISSTAHLVLIRRFLDWSTADSLAFDVSLHAGTLLSLIVCLRYDIFDMVGRGRRLLYLILIGTIPAGVIGFLFEDFVEKSLREPYIIVFSLTLIGVVMLIAERFQKTRLIEELTMRDALIVGFSQAIALVPGVSRSGITISTALLLGLRREDSARFAFLLSVPVILGAVVLEGRKIIGTGVEINEFLVGFIASFLSGVVAIKFLLRYLKKHPLNIFAYYRFGLAALIAVWLIGR